MTTKGLLIQHKIDKINNRNAVYRFFISQSNIVESVIDRRISNLQYRLEHTKEDTTKESLTIQIEELQNKKDQLNNQENNMGTAIDINDDIKTDLYELENSAFEFVDSRWDSFLNQYNSLITSQLKIARKYKPNESYYRKAIGKPAIKFVMKYRSDIGNDKTFLSLIFRYTYYKLESLV